MNNSQMNELIKLLLQKCAFHKYDDKSHTQYRK